MRQENTQTKNLVSGAWGKLGNTLKEATKNLGKYIDDITGPLRKAGQNLGNSMKAGLDKLNPAKAIEKLKGKIKPVIQEMLEKNPFVKKIMSWMSGKSKGAVKWVLKNIKKINGKYPALYKALSNGAFSYIGKYKVKVFNASFHRSKTRFHPFQNGLIFRMDKKNIYVAATRYSIKIPINEIISDINKKDFLIGKRFK